MENRLVSERRGTGQEFRRKDTETLGNTLSVSETPSIVGLHPPEHTRLRSLVGKAFTPDAVECHKPMIQGIAKALADRIDESRPFDVVPLYAKPLPVMVMAEIMGVDQHNLEELTEWVEDVEMLLGAQSSDEVHPTTSYIERRSDDVLGRYRGGAAKCAKR